MRILGPNDASFDDNSLENTVLANSKYVTILRSFVMMCNQLMYKGG